MTINVMTIIIDQLKIYF